MTMLSLSAILRHGAALAAAQVKGQGRDKSANNALREAAQAQELSSALFLIAACAHIDWARGRFDPLKRSGDDPENGFEHGPSQIDSSRPAS